MSIHTRFGQRLQGAKLFLLVDLEATCWERRNVKDMNEIIELGVVLCNTKGEMIGKFQSFIKPCVNIKMSPFCRRLTKIDQEDVNSAQNLEEVVLNLKEWAKVEHSVNISKINWASWGKWDKGCIINDCYRHGIPVPFNEHICLKTLYKEMRGVECGLREAVEREGLDWEGEQHRALSDAINSHKIAKLLLQGF